MLRFLGERHRIIGQGPINQFKQSRRIAKHHMLCSASLGTSPRFLDWPSLPGSDLGTQCTCDVLVVPPPAQRVWHGVTRAGIRSVSQMLHAPPSRFPPAATHHFPVHYLPSTPLTCVCLCMCVCRADDGVGGPNHLPRRLTSQPPPTMQSAQSARSTRSARSARRRTIVRRQSFRRYPRAAAVGRVWRRCVVLLTGSCWACRRC